MAVWGCADMRTASSPFLTAAQSMSYLLGGGVIALAIALGAWSIEPQAAVDWALTILSPGFVAAVVALTLGSLFCLVRLTQSAGCEAQADFWLGTGLQLSGGVATLALTYTLFGISVGIGSLAGQGLTPETVEGVIRDLTASFSLAFMTTVIGLPLSTALRSLLVVVHGRQRLASHNARALSKTAGV